MWALKSTRLHDQVSGKEGSKSEGYIVNHFEGALNPAMTGTDGQRFYEFSANRMTFDLSSTTVAGEQRTTRLTWERLE